MAGGQFDMAASAAFASVRQLAAMAHAAGYCFDCAICGRPFTAARVPKSGGILGDDKRCPGQAVIYLLCRKCSRLPAGEKAARLVREAVDPLQRAYLANSKPAGRA